MTVYRSRNVDTDYIKSCFKLFHLKPCFNYNKLWRNRNLKEVDWQTSDPNWWHCACVSWYQGANVFDFISCMSPNSLELNDNNIEILVIISNAQRDSDYRIKFSRTNPEPTGQKPVCTWCVSFICMIHGDHCMLYIQQTGLL